MACTDHPDDTLTIREAVHEDAPFIAALGIAAGMFPEEAAGFLADMVTAYAGGGPERGEGMAILVNTRPLGMVYWRPEEATHGTFDLTMIAVSPDAQRRGLGVRLIEYAERSLRNHGARLLLVKTTGSALQAPARAFYEKCGYSRAALIEDYWDTAEDLVVFRKAL